MSLVLHKKAFRELTLDELYELLRVRCEVFVVEKTVSIKILTEMIKHRSTCG